MSAYKFSFIYVLFCFILVLYVFLPFPLMQLLFSLMNVFFFVNINNTSQSVISFKLSYKHPSHVNDTLIPTLFMFRNENLSVVRRHAVHRCGLLLQVSHAA